MKAWFVLPVVAVISVVIGAVLLTLDDQHIQTVQAPRIQILDEIQTPENQTENIEIPNIPTPPPTIPYYDPDHIAMLVHQEINEIRVQNGLYKLQYDSVIAQTAKAHSQDMIDRNYFSHFDPDGVSPSERGRLAGYAHCGDKDTIELYKQVKIRDMDYEKKLADYNARLAKYEKEQAYYNTAGSGTLGLYESLQKQYQDLQRIESELEHEDYLLDQDVALVNQRMADKWFSDGFGENIAGPYVYDYIDYVDDVPTYHWIDEQIVVDAAISAWMESSGHRANVLREHIISEGVGVAIDHTAMQIMITQNIC